MGGSRRDGLKGKEDNIQEGTKLGCVFVGGGVEAKT